jgi:hypothetical protein
MPAPSNIDQIVGDILADMPLKEKAIIANLDEDKVPYLQYAFDVCIKDQLGEDDEMSKDVIHRIWEALEDETNWIGGVKQRFTKHRRLNHPLMAFQRAYKLTLRKNRFINSTTLMKLFIINRI